MSISKSYRTVTTASTREMRSVAPSPGALRYATNLIQWFFSLLNGLIGLRFLLKLIVPDQANPFAEAVYSVTSRFLWVFKGLTPPLSVRGGEVEFFSLVAIVIYAMLGWVIIQLLWLVFARRK